MKPSRNHSTSFLAVYCQNIPQVSLFCLRWHPLTSEHRERHLFSLFAFSHLLAVTISVKVQHTFEESGAGVTEDCVWQKRLSESVPPDSTLHILFLFTVGCEIFGRLSSDRLTPGSQIFSNAFLDLRIDVGLCL